MVHVKAVSHIKDAYKEKKLCPCYSSHNLQSKQSTNFIVLRHYLEHGKNEARSFVSACNTTNPHFFSLLWHRKHRVTIIFPLLSLSQLKQFWLSSTQHSKTNEAIPEVTPGNKMHAAVRTISEEGITESGFISPEPLPVKLL